MKFGGVSEKMSEKNPPKKAQMRPKFSFRFSRRLIRIIKIKIRFEKYKEK